MQPAVTENRSKRTPSTTTLLLAVDLLAMFACMMLALMTRFLGKTPSEHLIGYLGALPILLAFRVVAAHRMGLYDFRHRLAAGDHVFGGVAAAFWGVGVGYVFMALVQLYYTSTKLSRWVAVLDFALLAVWFSLSRALVLAWLHHTGYRVRLLIVGEAALCSELREEIQRHKPRLLELVETAKSSPLSSEVSTIDQILLASSEISQDDLKTLLPARWKGDTPDVSAARREIFMHPGLDIEILASTRVADIAGVPVIPLQPGSEMGLYRTGKRLVDFGVSLLALLVMAPLLIAAAIAVKISSRGPVLYSQVRNGQYASPFRIYKFRTMIVDAEDETGPILATAGDPRITPIGRLLRRWRIDEIPQLWNVLRGDMSLVGPRPERPEFDEHYRRDNPLYERRFAVKPGVTGLAQIHGRYDTDYRHKLRYDLIYINGLSFWNDTRVLVTTIKTVLSGKGAL